MARKGDEHSVYSTVARLLASLRSDESLRRNALVSHEFSEAGNLALDGDRVRTLVRASIDRIVTSAPPHSLDIARRQRQVLLCYDVGGQSRMKVSADLGITERQMYRDRRAALEQLGAMLLAARPNARVPIASVESILDSAEIALQGALRLNALGATNASYERAKAVARESGDVEARVIAMCLTAQLRIECEEFDEGSRLMNAAQKLFHSNKQTFAPVRVYAMESFFEVARARILWAADGPKATLGLARSGISKFFIAQQRMLSAADPAMQILLRDVIRAVALLTDCGDISGAGALLAAARQSIEHMPRTTGYLELEWRGAQARFQTLVAADHNALAREAKETMMLAQRAGVPAAASDAAQLAAWIAARRGDVREARLLQGAALGYIVSLDSLWQCSVIRVAAAIIERMIGTPKRSLELARLAAAGFRENTAGYAFATYTLARAQLTCGLFDEAFETAQRVVATSAPREYVRGAALLVMAESEEMLGRRHFAIEYADGALDLLRRYGSTYILAEAQALRARVA